MERFFQISLTFLLLITTIMECLQVILRYVFQISVLWLDETIIFPAIWMYMLGCANASREDTQIVAKIFPVLFPKPLACAIFDFCARIFSLIISIWLTWYAVEYFFYSLEVNRKTVSLFLPMFIGETAVAAGMIIITCYCFIHFLRSLKQLGYFLGKRPPLC